MDSIRAQRKDGWIRYMLEYMVQSNCRKEPFQTETIL
jgi:hypothetical protein